MNYHNKLNDLIRQIIDSLIKIEDSPAEWLPHTVYVEEEGEDKNGAGVPVYNPYKLLKIHPSGGCVLQNMTTKETEERHLMEINIEWLITVLNRYGELRAEECKQEAKLSREEKLEKALRLILDVAQHEIPCFHESDTYSVCEKAIETPSEKPKELKAFIYSIEHFNRDVSNEELLNECKNNPGGDEIRIMTPDQFAYEVNEEKFNDLEYCVRFIEV